MKPKAPVNDSLIALENHLSDIYVQPDDINILCGGVNIDHIRELSRKTNLQNRLSCFGLQCLNSNKPTRETEQNSSVIDVVYSNKKFQIEILETSITDHYALTVPRVAIGTQEDRKNTRNRNWNLLKNRESKEKLNLLTLIDLQKCKKLFEPKDIHSCFEHFNLKVQEIVNKFIPKKFENQDKIKIGLTTKSKFCLTKNIFC